MAYEALYMTPEGKQIDRHEITAESKFFALQVATRYAKRFSEGTLISILDPEDLVQEKQDNSLWGIEMKAQKDVLTSRYSPDVEPEGQVVRVIQHKNGDISIRLNSMAFRMILYGLMSLTKTRRGNFYKNLCKSLQGIY